MFDPFVRRICRVLALAPALGAAVLLAGSSPAVADSGCATAGSGVVSDFCLQPSDTAAGSDPSLTTTIDFNYVTPGDTVKGVTVTLPPGLLAIPTNAGATCSSDELSAGSCPADSQVGSGTVVARATILGLISMTVSSYSAMYAMAVPPGDASSDVAYFGIDAWLGNSAPKSGTSPLISVDAPAQVAVAGGQPAVELGFTGLPQQVTVPILGKAQIQVRSLTLMIDGTVPSASGGMSPFTRLPTSCAAATTTLSVDTYAGSSDGAGASSFTPTACGSLPFGPSLTAASSRDPTDLGASLTTTVTQPPGQAAASSIALTIPATTLAPDVVDAATSFGDVVGSAKAVTPLLPLPLTGTVTLTGNASAPALTIVFGPPVPLTLVGAIDLANNAVAFSGLPDVPLDSLTVTIDGGSDPLYATSCASPAGTIDGSFTGQNGATVSTGAPFDVSGCPLPAAIAYPYTAPPASAAPTTTSPMPPAHTSTPNKPPRVSHGSLSGLAKGHAWLRFTLSAGSAKLRSFTVTLPRGLGFAARRYKRGFSIKGARVGSLRLRHGRLLVVLRSEAGRAAVTLSAVALDEVGALRAKVRHRKVKFVRVQIVARDASGRSTTLRIRLRV